MAAKVAYSYVFIDLKFKITSTISSAIPGITENS